MVELAFILGSPDEQEPTDGPPGDLDGIDGEEWICAGDDGVVILRRR